MIVELKTKLEAMENKRDGEGQRLKELEMALDNRNKEYESLEERINHTSSEDSTTLQPDVRKNSPRYCHYYNNTKAYRFG